MQSSDSNVLFSCRTITPSTRAITPTILSTRKGNIESVLSAQSIKKLVFIKDPIKNSNCFKKITPIRVFNGKVVCDTSISTTDRSIRTGDKLLNTREFRQYSSKVNRIKRFETKSPTSFINSLDVLFDKELKGQRRKNTKEGSLRARTPKAVRVKGFLGSRRFIASKPVERKV
ncbi:hypothetical protein SteCoe_34799 [Stentor coeruleus]|uniref:Uncharacterized protein n=1 Tax=Stentor coeruleus TaxID=5963 RepID=A0A1R2ATS4_9CILI|nr:hypothetical protein SteCoe_34799 [Stentor coeruleus]